MTGARLFWLLGLVAMAAATPALAEDAKTAPGAAAAPCSTPKTTSGIEAAVGKSLAARITSLPTPATEPERKDREALIAFYAGRACTPLWLDKGALGPRAAALIGEIRNADAYGLDTRDFKLPAAPVAGASPDQLADAELQLTLAALTYARYARGGRIADPADMLTTNIDRRPQWLDPKAVLARLAGSEAPDAVLRDLEPKHVQFERLRQLYVAALAKSDGIDKLSPAAKRLRANMEMWRWMPDDMGGTLYVLNNIPEFTQYVYKDGQVIRTERIVVGELDKQSAIFSRPLKYVVLRPMWRVPESIKVNELWPSLLRGGGLMRKYGLQLQTKDGQDLDWHKINWAKSDIRDYDVIQPPGSKSVLGHVKFSFPSQHTIYMHDTPDKWMFRPAQRTLSHGCLRVRNPMALAELILKEDKGWDAAKIADLDRSGPLNNEIAIDRKIPIHLVYFTAWVDDDGKLKTFGDIYGHEKRVTLALDGKWDKIDKGRDHLAPVEPNFDPAAVAASAKRATQKQAAVGFSFDPFGLGW